ncbi:HlyD family secretion protein [Roseiarcus fermentans]|uniref:HlyD family secretion protein n=1 Tax=Roseiarcus fermentans TaxID=1473586 RepID=A0A366F374_9HYPH|nr:HlyD family efflux transporter periplasmic adaptor subunit [Roseiarcus fermentans]RBP08199.1 HlyD family secretion protein [Roseiarcus fermentans]
MIRRFLVPAVVIALVAGAGWALFRPRPPAPVAWQGYAEADFVKIGPTQAGLLTAVRVARGDRVVKGQPLFTQDDADDRAAVDQARRLLQQARGQLANLMAPAKTSEIDQAQANLGDAQAARDRAQEDLRRSAQLLKSGSATQQVVDQQDAALRSAEAKVAAATAALATAQAPMGRPSEIEAQRSMVDALEAALKQAQWRLDQRSVTAPEAGIIADVIAFPGETLSAGAPAVSLLPPGNVFVRFFIPEPQLAKIHVGDRVDFACDNCPADLGGVVSYIAPSAEYTPPFIYSETNRSKFVFLAEARPPSDQARLLNPGQPVTVAPAAQAAAPTASAP